MQIVGWTLKYKCLRSPSNALPSADCAFLVYTWSILEDPKFRRLVKLTFVFPSDSTVRVPSIDWSEVGVDLTLELNSEFVVRMVVNAPYSKPFRHDLVW